jgi:hypothetical protein
LETVGVTFEKDHLRFRIFRWFRYRIFYADISTLRLSATQYSVKIGRTNLKQRRQRIYILSKKTALYLFEPQDENDFISKISAAIPHIHVIQNPDRTRELACEAKGGSDC